MTAQAPVLCGVVTSKTKFTFRTRSSNIIWLVQMSAEMWEFDDNHNLKFESFVNHFVPRVFREWDSVEATHCLSIVFFSRVYFDGITSPDAWPKEAQSNIQHDPFTGQFYRDHYKVVVSEASPASCAQACSPYGCCRKLATPRTANHLYASLKKSLSSTRTRCSSLRTMVSKTRPRVPRHNSKSRQSSPNT